MTVFDVEETPRLGYILGVVPGSKDIVQDYELGRRRPKTIGLEKGKREIGFSTVVEGRGRQELKI